MALNFGLNASFDNMWKWKATLERVGEVNSTKAYVTDVETPPQFSTGFTYFFCNVPNGLGTVVL
jgi:hypothetical protein